MTDALPSPGSQVIVDGHLSTVVAATATADGADVVLRREDGTLTDAALSRAQLHAGIVPENDGGSNGEQDLLVSGVAGPAFRWGGVRVSRSIAGFTGWEIFEAWR